MALWIDKNRRHIGSQNVARIAINSDDGAVTDYMVMEPYMRARGLKGMTAIATDNIGVSGMSIAQVNALLSQGYWEVWAHTKTHPLDAALITESDYRDNLTANNTE